MLVSCLAGAVPYGNDEGWKIVAEEYGEDYTGVPMSNGIIGVMPWKEPFSVKHVMLNHVFERIHDVNCAVRGINPFGLAMSVDGTDVSGNGITGWKQTIDLRNAGHITEFVAYGKVYVKYTVTALRNLPYSMLMEVELKALEDASVEFRNSFVIPEEYRSPRILHRKIWADGHLVELMRADAETVKGRYDVSSSVMFVHDGSFFRKTDAGSDMISALMKSGESRSFTLVASECTTKDFSDPYSETERQLVYIGRETVERVKSAHKALWEELWQGDIEIDGDMEAQHAVRLALFNLYGFCREGSRLSISPMGLSSQGYNGHIFWDTELWMYPPMLIMNQGIARSMIDYRTDRIPAARKRALAYGYRGVMFPWESDSSGEESTPTWAITGPMEHHITADVGIAAWNYWCVSRNREWLLAEGWPLLREVAEFWTSRAVRNADGSYSIEGVVGADEYAQNVTDNAFTNGAVKVVLDCAVKAAKECGLKAPGEWSAMADGLRISKGPDGAVLEYEGYDGRMIKQADVNLLGYPLGLITDVAQQRTDLEYYKDRIDPVNGPAMSFSVFCVQYARMGDRMKAEEMFRKSYRPNIRPPFGALAETPTSNNPYFATAAGGLLQAVLNGFGGLEITDRGIVRRKSLLPESWKRLVIRGAGPDRKTYVIENK